MNDSPEDISNTARGHKANLSNPNTSEESKEHSRAVLEELGGESAFYSKQDDDSGKNPGNVAGGLKATINNPNETSQRQVSDEAKESAKERLEGMK